MQLILLLKIVLSETFAKFDLFHSPNIFSTFLQIVIYHFLNFLLSLFKKVNFMSQKMRVTATDNYLFISTMEPFNLLFKIDLKQLEDVNAIFFLVGLFTIVKT